MSSTTLVSGELGPDGVRRYRTKIKLIVHSHNSSEPVDATSAVSSFTSGKMLKSVGNLNVSLTASRNWLNIIYPNDYVNLYVDRGDGQGWTRLFYGFVDEIKESWGVDQSGIPTTSYSLGCSDFQKAFEKTQIYFNPHVASRADFNGGFVGTPNIGGLGLMTRGVRVNGSPADLVINLILLLMGFGTQFTLPTSYNPRLADRLRQQRADFILNRLSSDARQQVLDAGGYANYLEQLRTEANLTSDVTTLTDPDSTSSDDVQRAERQRLREAAVGGLGGPGSSVNVESSRGARERGIEAYNVLNTTLTGYPPSLLDVIDVFTFIEREAIDGYTIGAPLWEHQGSVGSFLNSISNEPVNELFFDLRPVSRDGGLTVGTDFSREPDDLEGNAGTGETVGGIQYVPAIVMREYPFAVVNSIDASDISLTVRSSVPGGSNAPETLGLIYFGAIFSDQPNIPGRHVITIPNQNPDDLAGGRPATAGKKHIDVAVVHAQEIVKSEFTRSDADHYNLFEFYSDAMLGNSARFFMQDLLPIITPIHVVRHGLRVRSLNTRFGRFSLDTIDRTQPQDTPANETEEAPPPETPPPSDTVFPVELLGNASAGYSQGFVTTANQWWYRPKTFDGRRPVNNVAGNAVPPAGVRYYRFHNGVDVHATRGTPVRAFRDGRVVMAAPVGTRGRNGYGNVVAIFHPADNLYSLYAHLDSFAPTLSITSRSRNLSAFAADEYVAGGTFTPVDVRAGDVIGYVGDTDSDGAVHLHFEINVVRNGRCYPSGRDRVNLTPDVFRDASTAVAGFQIAATRPANPDESLTISQDPVRVLQNFGRTWPVQPVSGIPTTPVPDADPLPAEMYPGDEAEDALDTDHEVAPVPTAAATEDDTPVSPSTTAALNGHVDTPSTRRQIARWALLNDHWYQHNLEYLSGVVEMRGAPEIRVGYRLDLPERNISAYVEGVNHSWSYGRHMTSTLQITRGQPSNPYPAYVLPYINGFDPTETQRQTGSRLASYFIVPDPISVRRALTLEAQRSGQGVNTPTPIASRASANANEIDMPNENGTLVEKYNEQILPAESVSVPYDIEEALAREKETLGLRGANASTTSATTNPMGGVPDDLISDAFSIGRFGKPPEAT